VRGFRVDAAGNWLWGTEPLGVATLLSGKARLPVAGAPDGTALLVWEDDRGGTVDVYGQNVRPDGSLGGDLTAVPATPAPAASLSAWPNPFNPSTALSLRLAAAGPARLSIHDARGRAVRVLADAEFPAGESLLHWDGRDATGAPMPTGLYFARVSTAGSPLTHKLLLLK
jgi:hypothetical protein